MMRTMARTTTAPPSLASDRICATSSSTSSGGALDKKWSSPFSHACACRSREKPAKSFPASCKRREGAQPRVPCHTCHNSPSP